MPERAIPFSKPFLGPEEREEILKVLDSGWLTAGPLTRRFEEEFQRYIGSKHAVAVSSCTAAMHLCLLALGVGEGDEIITTPFTFPATANVILHAGAIPVFIDIEGDSGNLDPNRLKDVIHTRYRYDRARKGLVNKQTGTGLKGILPVHYAGHPCDMEALKEIAEEFSLFIVEDAAHALGAKLKGVSAGRWGIAGCFSFYPTKTITTGEGGMIVTDDSEMARKVRILGNHGITRDSWSRYGDENIWFYEVTVPGFKCNMTDIQAALGIHQLARLTEIIVRREAIVERYESALKEIPGLMPLRSRPGVLHARHIYPVLVEREITGIARDDLIQALRVRGVSTSVHFIPLHFHSYFQERLGYTRGDFPVAEKLFEGILSLPLYPGMSVEELGYVLEVLADLCSNKKASARANWAT